MSVEEIGLVLEQRKLGEGLFSLKIKAPEIVSSAQCGQFVHIATGEGNLLRRPISICDAENDMLHIVFQTKGEGTKWLSERKIGDMLNILGPLGHGYDLEKLGKNPVFIGGGIGVPPMLFAVKKCIESGGNPKAILGFRSKDAVILEKDFPCETLVCTDDGSYARKGFVTDLLKEQVDNATGVASCGPKPMLKGIAEIAEKAALPCQVSMEERMGCGIGACLVCACALQAENGETKYGHVCKDGPVFDAREVQW